MNAFVLVSKTFKKYDVVSFGLFLTTRGKIEKNKSTSRIFVFGPNAHTHAPVRYGRSTKQSMAGGFWGKPCTWAIVTYLERDGPHGVVECLK